MKSDPSLNQKDFDELLAWLDRDSAKAGEKYEKIRTRLIQFFLNRQCYEAEDLADETINRVARKPEEWKNTYAGEPVRYFYAVARNVCREHRRQQNKALHPPPEVSRDELEPYLECLDSCLAKLPEDNRTLILPYYEEQRAAKISSHKEIGNRMRLNPGALRARVYRIRSKLRACVEECIGNLSQSNDIKSSGI